MLEEHVSSSRTKNSLFSLEFDRAQEFRRPRVGCHFDRGCLTRLATTRNLEKVDAYILAHGVEISYEKHRAQRAVPLDFVAHLRLPVSTVHAKFDGGHRRRCSAM